MNIRNIFFILYIFTMSGLGATDGIIRLENSYERALIPYPLSIDIKGSLSKGNSFEFTETGEAKLVSQEIKRFRQQFLDLGSAKNKLVISLQGIIVPGNNSEYYEISIRQNGTIEIRAQHSSGFFNALQTCKQLIHKQGEIYVLPICEIKDEPAFPVRGIMLDVGRYYLSPKFIKKLVTKLSNYKINVLHLHLTDDPAWRMEIKNFPELTDAKYHWKHRLPGMFYTQDELKDLIAYCKEFHVRVIPELDMPGHSAVFRKALKYDMQTDQGVNALQTIIDETVEVFDDEWLHIGSDEAHLKMKDFMSRMLSYLKEKGKTPIVWHPGLVKNDDVIYMCWGENEAGATLKKDKKHIDCNGFYLDWMDSQSGVYQCFFQQPCEMPKSDGLGLGSIMAVWCDGALSSEQRILEQYPFYPCALTFSERIWRGKSEKRKDYMAQLPAKGTKEWSEFAVFEDRLVFHRDNYFKKEPFSYVKQADIVWKLIGPFPHGDDVFKRFAPEEKIQDLYNIDSQNFVWQKDEACGGAIHIRHLYSMFNQHAKRYRLDHWPTLMSSTVKEKDGTCYALTYIKSPKNQTVYLMFGLNGMWGHSGGYRSGRAPEQGTWDYLGGDIWINDKKVKPPKWPFESLAWGGWGAGRIEEAPLTQEGYFFRPPVKISLKKGLNKVLVKTVAGARNGEHNECKWMFCCIPVLWNGLHYREVPNLIFTTNKDE